MKIETKVLWRVLAGPLIAMPLASYAETESTQLDVEMSVAEAITFSCDTPLSFGVTRIPLKGDSAGKITLDSEGNLSSVESDDFSLDDGAHVGECQLSGSVAKDGTSIDVTLPRSREMAGDAVLNLSPGKLRNPEVYPEASTETVDANGEATIKIHGTLQLKEGELDKNDYGGYSVTIDVQVEI